MTNDTTAKSRIIMASLCCLAGILSITLIPKFGGMAMDSVMLVGWSKIAESGAIAPKMVSFFFPAWMGVSIIAGVVLILLSLPVYRGEYWGRPLAMGMLAIPCIAAAYFFGPIMVTSRQLAPQAVIMLAIGLIPYFLILLLERSSIRDRLINFLVFLLLGIMSAASFTNGFSSLHDVLYRPSPIVLTSVTELALGVTIVWMGIILVLCGLPLLAARVFNGWLLTIIGTSSILVGTMTFYLTKQNQFYLASLSVTLLTLLLLLMPSIKERLIGPSLNTSNSIN